MDNEIVLELKGKVSNLYRSLTKVTMALDKMGASTGELGKKSKTLRERLKDIGSEVKKMFPTLSKLLSSIGRIAFYRAIRTLVSGITNGFREGTIAIYNWSKALETTNYAQSLDSLTSSWEYMKQSFAVGFAPLFESIAMWMDKIADKFAQAIEFVSKFFAILTGSDYYIKATKTQESFAESTDNATASLKRFLGKFDELNVMDGNTGSGSKASADTTLKFFEKVTAQGLKIKDLISELSFTEIALGLGAMLTTIIPLVAKLKDFFSIGGKIKVGLGLLVFGILSITSAIDDFKANGEWTWKALGKLELGILAVGGAISLLTGSWIPLAIAGVVGLVTLIVAKWDEISAVLSSAFTFVINIFQKVSIWLTETFPKTGIALVDAVNGTFKNVVDIFKNVFSTLKALVNGDWKQMWTSFGNIGVICLQGLLDIILVIPNALVDMVNLIIRVINTAIEMVGTLFGKNWQGLDSLNHITISLQGNNSTSAKTPQIDKSTKGMAIKGMTFATGGFPEDGFFFANHNELVGQFSNGRTAVANNEQIIEGIKQGVSQALASNGQNIRVDVDGNKLFDIVVNKNNSIVRQTGMTPLVY